MGNQPFEKKGKVLHTIVIAALTCGPISWDTDRVMGGQASNFEEMVHDLLLQGAICHLAHRQEAIMEELELLGQLDLHCPWRFSHHPGSHRRAKWNLNCSLQCPDPNISFHAIWACLVKLVNFGLEDLPKNQDSSEGIQEHDWAVLSGAPIYPKWHI